MRLFVVTLLALCAGCTSKHEPPPPPPEKPPEPPPPRKKIGPADFGSCTLKASGAFTAEETIPGDKKSVSSKYWQSEDERSAAPLPALTINCSGKDLRLSIVSAPHADVPYGLKTYVIEGKNSEVVLLGRAGDQLSDFKGTVTLDVFDNKHVAGKIQINAKQGMGKKRVTIEGNFDFACPGMAGCAK
jgi:hypothetical protein